jgi:hypothetical protein
MDASTQHTEALRQLNMLHAHVMLLLEETLDAAEDGIALVEGAKLGVHYVQASVAILGMLKRLDPAVRGRLRAMLPSTRFVCDEGGAQP